MESQSFYRNVFLLTQMVPPDKEFRKYFREGMFDKPNTPGFIHTVHYLLTTYDEERFKKMVEWPILDKKDEGKYRNQVKDMINAIASENSDIDMLLVLPSHLHTASGMRFINLMWKLSTMVLRAQLRREGAEIMTLAPKSGDGDDLKKNMLTNLIAEKKKDILALHTKKNDVESRAKEISDKMTVNIEKSKKDFADTKIRLENMVACAKVHANVKTRMADPNDTEIVEKWKDNIAKSIFYLKSQMEILNNVRKKSESVAAVVNSVLNSETNCLDAEKLPKIQIDKLLDIDLEPDAQVAVHHLYEEGKLNLNNLLVVLEASLKKLRGNFTKNPPVDLAECNLQVQVSTEDLNRMLNLIEPIQECVDKLKVSLAPITKPPAPPKNPNLSFHLDSDVFESIVLKSSPTINLMANDPERYDAAERLELTPVEGVHKSLFQRYKNNDTPTIPKPFKTRPKMAISRINFDDSFSSTISEKFSPMRRVKSQVKSGKFSRLFTTAQKKGFNHTFTSPANSIVHGDVYNMSDIKPHLTNQRSFNLSRDLVTPVNFTPEKNTVNKISNYVEKPAFNSTEIVTELTTINENMEIRLTIGKSPNIQKKNKKEDNRRISIGDLVEKYRKIREQSTNVTYLENSGENSDDSTK